MKNQSFWIWGTIVFQIATGLIHSLSFFTDQIPANETEKQLLNLMNNYLMDMGVGFHRSMGNIFISLSACMTMLCLYSGLTNLVLWQRKIDNSTMKSVMLINAILFGSGFIIMLRFAFLPPVVCFALIFICSLMAFLRIPKTTIR